MNPTIATALMQEHREELLRQAAQHRRLASARSSRASRTPAAARRVSVRPFVVFQNWLAHGYL